MLNRLQQLSPLPIFPKACSIGARIGFVLIISVALASLATYLLAQIVILNGFRQTEMHDFETGMGRVVYRIEAELDQLGSINGDWSLWNDAYDYAKGTNPEFWPENVHPEILMNLGLNNVIFINTQGQVVGSLAIDESGNRVINIPSDVLKYTLNELPVTSVLNGTESWQRIALTRRGPLLIAAHPQLRTDRSGPPAGVVIFARLLTPERVQRLARDTNQEFTVLPFGSTNVSAGAARAMIALKSGTDMVTDLVDDQTAVVYGVIRDTNGHPLLLLQLNFHRDAFIEGEHSIRYFLAALLISGFAIGIATLLILKSRVLSRLASLDEQVAHIQPDCSSDTRISLSGNDELSRLANVINNMLASLRSSGAKIRQARDEALEASRLKTQILANVSHDARTPMTIIRLRAQMLQTGVYGPLNDKQIEALVSIVSSSDQMLFFVNNLLDASALTNNSLKLKPTEFEPQALIDKSVLPLQILAKQKKLSLRGRVDPAMPCGMHGDFNRLTQIVFNLVGNALKFTEQGSVDVVIERAGAEEWRIVVRDTGIGVPESSLNKLFEAFYQVDGSTHRQVNSGVGLGLSIVKQLTELMHGRIDVTSTMGVGSTFIVTLPLLQSQLDIDDAVLMAVSV